VAEAGARLPIEVQKRLLKRFGEEGRLTARDIHSAREARREEAGEQVDARLAEVSTILPASGNGHQLIADLKSAHHEAMVAWKRYADSGWQDRDALELYDAKFAIVSRMIWELKEEEA
jgi:hypothetical protein